jgi:hypothetical protein
MNFEIGIMIVIGVINIVLKRCIMLKLILYEVALCKTLVLILIPLFNISHPSIVCQTLLILSLIWCFNLRFLCLHSLFLVHLRTV